MKKSRNPAVGIIQDRIDMTEWVLHFIHDNNLENEPTDDAIPYEDYGTMAYHMDPAINYRFSDWDYMDQYGGFSPGASAFHVLLKIISDGHIRATWAFRNGRPTIYGPRAAVCVTEMPLYALVDYAKRREPTSVGGYAVGLLKSEFFAAGGRPVIYGLSTEGAIQYRSHRKWPRILDEAHGIAEAEQYRYVTTALDSKRPIDWTHEREWRWADNQDRHWCPGLPVWLQEETHFFSETLVIVQTNEEAERILDLLKQLYDAGSNGFIVEIRRDLIDRTAVISLEQLRENMSDDLMLAVRLEDIPRKYLRKFETPPATLEDIDKLRRVLAEARSTAAHAMHDEWEASPKGADGHIMDVVGFAHLVVHEAQTPLVSALLELDEASPLGGDGYLISNVKKDCEQLDQALRLQEAAVRAAQAVFERHYPEHLFEVRVYWD